MSLIQGWCYWRYEVRLDMAFSWDAAVRLLKFPLWLLILHLFIDGAHELILFLKISSDIVSLLPKFVGHLYDYMIIECFWSITCLIVATVLRDCTIDLHDVVDYVEIVVNGISTSQDVLRCNWLCRMSAAWGQGLWQFFFIWCLFEEIILHRVLWCVTREIIGGLVGTSAHSRILIVKVWVMFFQRDVCLFRLRLLWVWSLYSGWSILQPWVIQYVSCGWALVGVDRKYPFQ